MLEIAQNLLHKKDFSNAMAAFKEVIRNESDNARAYSGLASSLYGLKRYSDARLAAEQAIKLDASLAEPYIIWAYINIVKEDNPQISYQLAERAYILEPDSLIVKKGFGLTSIFSGKYDQGVRLLEQVYESQKDDPQIQELIILGYFKQKRYLEAYRTSQKVYHQHHSYANAYDMVFYYLFAHPAWGILFVISQLISLLAGLFHPLLMIYPTVIWLLAIIKRTIVFPSYKNFMNGFYLVFGYLVLSGFIWWIFSTRK